MKDENLDQFYNSFDKNLYRVGENNLIMRMLRPAQGSNSSGFGESGVNYSTNVQAVGSIQSGKKLFDNTVPGYILGFDPRDGFAKFYIGNTTDYLNWDGSTMTISGTFVIGSKIITVTDIADLQTAIDSVSLAGGGTVSLAPGSYTATSNITVPSNVTFQGFGATIDFGGGAHQIRVVGTNAYSTGTVAVSNDGTSVVGTGTTWTQSMVGQKILMIEFWYEITAVTNSTHLTIGTPFIGSTVSGAIYSIATTIDNANLLGFSVQNSSIALIKIQYINTINVESINMVNGLIGFDGDDSSFMNFSNCNVDTCGTGITLNNFYFNTFFNFNVLNSTSGGGVVCNNVTNSGFEIWCLKNNTGNALDLTSVSDSGFEDFSSQETTGIGIKCVSCDGVSFMDGTISHASSDGIQLTSTSRSDFVGLQISNNSGQGIECVSGNNDIQFTNLSIDSNTSDGVKYTATTDRVSISTCSIINNGGWGLNIADATCDNNVIGGIAYYNNTTGTYNDSGTGTTILGGSSMPVGSILEYGGSSAPTGYLLCDGTSYLQATYATLYAIIGTSYGSVDGTHFNVPDKRGRVGVGKNAGTFNALGNTGGAETVTLDSTMIPSHTHNIWNGTGAGSSQPNVGLTRNNNSSGTDAVTQPTGGGLSHNNLQPYQVFNYIIKT